MTLDSKLFVPPTEKGTFRRFFSNLGPGVITGAADDDPSGISSGFRIRAAMDRAVLVSAHDAVQLMCARLGLVTGLGLAGVIRRRYSRWVLWGACTLLVVANVINIAADLGGMAEATMMVTGAPDALMVPVYGVVIVLLRMRSSYRTIAPVFS
jgi:Mn2+/Fe2+ NRAMP family transporter